MNQNDAPDTGTTSGEAQQPDCIRTYSRWQLFFLERLHRQLLVSAKLQAGELGEVEPFEQVGLNKAIFSTLLDCESAGIGADARRLIQTLPDWAVSH